MSTFGTLMMQRHQLSSFGSKMVNTQENIIMTKSFQFAVEVIRFCDELEKDRRYVIANQLLKSGTSIGAQVREAQNAESKADFIHKFKIAAKETEETEYWLLLVKSAYNKSPVNQLLTNIAEIKRIISKIIISSKMAP